MNILVIGSGGREHALAWKLRQSPKVDKVWSAPGNGGTHPDNADLPATDHAGLIRFAKENRIDLTVVGPDDALAAGMVDDFSAAGLRAFGPVKAAARLESSKIFAKEFMARHGIPTAKFGSFDRVAAAEKFLASVEFPVVVKADGLALGKGVIICPDHNIASRALREMMRDNRFGEAGRAVVIEEFLEGEECSMHLLIDGAHALLFPSIRDYKRIGDGDQGPNTGGMGTFSPSPRWTAELESQIQTTILEPLLKGLQSDGIPFQGLLYPGLMLTSSGPKVLEFNCRFGDPETQALMPRLKSDLVPLLEATLDGTLDRVKPEWDPRPSVCVVMASAGYPGSVEKGFPITGLESPTPPDSVVFHAGTRHVNGTTVTNGGRVLGVTALGDDLAQARTNAYARVEKIRFDGCQYRRDIAQT